jgi:hypothetical protein
MTWLYTLMHICICIFILQRKPISTHKCMHGWKHSTYQNQPCHHLVPEAVSQPSQPPDGPWQVVAVVPEHNPLPDEERGPQEPGFHRWRGVYTKHEFCVVRPNFVSYDQILCCTTKFCVVRPNFVSCNQILCRATKFAPCDTNRSLSICVARPNFWSYDKKIVFRVNRP